MGQGTGSSRGSAFPSSRRWSSITVATCRTHTSNADTPHDLRSSASRHCSRDGGVRRQAEVAPVQTPVPRLAAAAARRGTGTSLLPGQSLRSTGNAGPAARVYAHKPTVLRRGHCLPLERPDVLGLRSLFAADRGVLDALVVLQASVAVGFDRRVMNEHIRRSIVGRDKAVALIRVKPFHCSLGHCGFLPE